MNIQYQETNLLELKEVHNKKIIIHICNELGIWAGRFGVRFSLIYSQAEEEYRKWYEKINKNNCYSSVLPFGEIQKVVISDSLEVVNIIAQEGVKFSHNKTPVKYDAFRECLEKVVEVYKHDYNLPTIYFSELNLNDAGAEKEKIESIINDTLIKNAFSVTITNHPMFSIKTPKYLKDKHEAKIE